MMIKVCIAKAPIVGETVELLWKICARRKQILVEEENEERSLHTRDDTFSHSLLLNSVSVESHRSKDQDDSYDDCS